MKRSKRPIVITKKLVGHRLGQKVASSTLYGATSGSLYRPGGPLDKVVVSWARTQDSDGNICPQCITFTISRCIYVSFGSPGTNVPSITPGNGFTYYLNGVEIAPLAGTFPVANDSPFVKTWTVTFAADAIATARGQPGVPEADVWLEDDLIELSLESPDNYWISQDCSTTSITDLPVDEIAKFPVNNLYSAPQIIGAKVI